MGRNHWDILVYILRRKELICETKQFTQKLIMLHLKGNNSSDIDESCFCDLMSNIFCIICCVHLPNCVPLYQSSSSYENILLLYCVIKILSKHWCVPNMTYYSTCHLTFKKMCAILVTLLNINSLLSLIASRVINYSVLELMLLIVLYSVYTVFVNAIRGRWILTWAECASCFFPSFSKRHFII